MKCTIRVKNTSTIEDSAKLALSASLCLVFVIAGCASGPPKSGFLGDYSNFEKVRDDAPVWDFADPTGVKRESLRVELWRDASGLHNLSQYDRIIVEPTKLMLKTHSRGHHVDPRKVSELVQNAHDAFVAALEDHYPVVDEAGPGVLRFRTAITDLHPIHKYKHATNIHRSVNTRAGGASFESEAVDSVSGVRVMALICEIEGSSWDAAEQADIWSQTNNSLGGFGRIVRELMDQAHSGTLGSQDQ